MPFRRRGRLVANSTLGARYRPLDDSMLPVPASQWSSVVPVLPMAKTSKGVPGCRKPANHRRKQCPPSPAFQRTAGEGSGSIPPHPRRMPPQRRNPTVSFPRKEPIPSGIPGAQRTARGKRNKCRRPSEASYAGFPLAGSERRNRKAKVPAQRDFYGLRLSKWASLFESHHCGIHWLRAHASATKDR